MSDDHIGVKVNGVIYVKLEDARKLREGWDKADDRIAELEAALRSIASNTCCDKCQEAALVARAALAGGKR